MKKLLGLLFSSILALGMIFPNPALVANVAQDNILQSEIVEEVSESKENEKQSEEEMSVESSEDSEKMQDENTKVEELSTKQASTTSVSGKEIQIIATSDLHNHFYPFQYATNAEYTKGSLARVATFVKSVRTPNTIVIDNGDTIQDNSGMLFLNDPVVPMIAGMNEIGYDYWISGNHEYNFGVDSLEKIVGTFNGQFLVSNVYRGAATAANRLQGAKNYDIKEIDGVKVATIGIVTPNITKWDGENLQGYTVTDPMDEVGTALQEIGDTVDAIIVSFHASVGGEYPGMTDSAAAIAEQYPEIDLIIAGHEHALMDEEVNGVKILEPASYGDYVSKAVITIGENGAENVVVGENVTMDGVEPDQAILDLLAPQHLKATTYMSQEIGELVDGPLIPENEVPGIPQAQVEDSALIDLILKVQMNHVEKNYTIPEGAHHVSGAALFDINANVQPGPIRRYDASKIYKYDNELRTVKTTGKDLKNYMEWSARYYNQQQYGDLTVSFNKDIRAYNYDMFGGVDYEVHVSKVAGERIEKLVYSDTKVTVEDGDIIYLTVNDYRVNTQFLPNNDILTNKEIVYSTANTDVANIREIIGEYIENEAGGVISPELDNNWKITGTNWNTDKRALLIDKVKEGKIEVPTSYDKRTPNVKSLGWADVEALPEITSVALSSVNDIHGAVSESSSNPGVAKFGGAVKRFKDYHENAVFLGSGDLYQGTAISNLTQGEVMNEVFQELGMQYSAVGNHEFDWGIDKMPKFAADGGFKFLAANIVNKSDGEIPEWAEPTTMLEIDGKKIGLIGLSPESTKYQTSAENVADIEFIDPVPVTKQWEAKLRADGADAVIVLSHLGSVQNPTSGYVDEGSELAAAVPTIDGVFTAHYHLTVNKTVGDVPVVQGANNGRALSQITLVFDDKGNVQSIGEVENLRNQIPTLPVDTTIAAIVEKYEQALEGTLGKKVAEAKFDYHHDASELDNHVTPMGQLTAKIMTDLGETDIAVINGGGIRTGLEQGDITMGNMYEIFPFDNTLVTMKMKGKDIKDIIEHGMPPVNYKAGQFYGINVYYDRDENGDPIISEMQLLDGTRVEMEQEYTVASLDFLIGGGDEYDFSKATDVVDTMTPLRDKIVGWMEEQGVVDYEFEKNIFMEAAPEPKPIEDVFTIAINEISYPYKANVTEEQFFQDLGLTKVGNVTLSSNFDSVTFDKSGNYTVTIVGTLVTRNTRAVYTTTKDVTLTVQKDTSGNTDGTSDKPTTGKPSGTLVETGQPILEQIMLGTSLLGAGMYAVRKRKNK